MTQLPVFGFFGDMALASQAVNRLNAMGVAPDAISVHVARVAPERDHMGSFADTGAHAHTAERDHVGSFADTDAHMHTAERDHVGSFADTGAHIHTAERDHVGSFADTERGAGALSHLQHELEGAGLSAEGARRAAARVAGGAVLVLVQIAGDQAAEVQSALAG